MKVSDHQWLEVRDCPCHTGEVPRTEENAEAWKSRDANCARILSRTPIAGVSSCPDFAPVFVRVLPTVVYNSLHDHDRLMPILTDKWTAHVYWVDTMGTRITLNLYRDFKTAYAAKLNGLKIAQGYKILLPSIIEQRRKGVGLMVRTFDNPRIGGSPIVRAVLPEEQESLLLNATMSEDDDE